MALGGGGCCLWPCIIFLGGYLLGGVGLKKTNVFCCIRGAVSWLSCFPLGGGGVPFSGQYNRSFWFCKRLGGGGLDKPDDYDSAHIEAVILATGERRLILQDASMARYVPTGHLIFGREGVLFAVTGSQSCIKTLTGCTRLESGSHGSFCSRSKVGGGTQSSEHSSHLRNRGELF